MSKIHYDEHQVKELLANKYVKDCSFKYILFTDEFKIKALELDKKFIYHKTIFKDSGFPEYIYNSKIPKNSLGNWRYKLKNKGLSGLIKTKKGRKKKKNKDERDITKMTLNEQNEYIKAENAYLKELHKTAYGDYP